MYSGDTSNANNTEKPFATTLQQCLCHSGRIGLRRVVIAGTLRHTVNVLCCRQRATHGSGGAEICLAKNELVVTYVCASKHFTFTYHFEQLECKSYEFARAHFVVEMLVIAYEGYLMKEVILYSVVPKRTR